MKTQLSFILITIFLSSCKAGLFEKHTRIESAGREARSEAAFHGLLLKLDELGDDSNKELLPALMAESQMSLARFTIENEGSEYSGHCLIYINKGAKFETEQVESSDIQISSGGRVAYSVSRSYKPSECMSLFRDGIPKRFQWDFFNLNVSFFRY